MSRIIRSAKSGSDWTYKELEAYHIEIRNQPAKIFFGQDFPATLTHIDPEFLTAKVPADAASHDTQRLLTYLDLATKANAGQESAVDDFARELLRMLGFEESGTILRTRYAIPLNICGEPSRSAQTDILSSPSRINHFSPRSRRQDEIQCQRSGGTDGSTVDCRLSGE